MAFLVTTAVMRKLITAISGFALAVTLLAQAAPKGILFSWDYPDPVPPDSFILRWTTNSTLPVASWPIYAVIPGTNSYGKANTNFVTALNPGVYAFYLTASNSFWGESDPSNTAQTPAAPGRGGNLKVGRQ